MTEKLPSNKVRISNLEAALMTIVGEMNDRIERMNAVNQLLAETLNNVSMGAAISQTRLNLLTDHAKLQFTYSGEATEGTLRANLVNPEDTTRIGTQRVNIATIS